MQFMTCSPNPKQFSYCLYFQQSSVVTDILEAIFQSRSKFESNHDKLRSPSHLAGRFFFYLGIAFGTREARRKVDSEAEQVALAAAQVAFRLREESKSR